MEHGAKYYVTVTAVNSVDMTENAFSEAIGVDLTPPQKGMVVDLTSVYRIDVSSSDNTVAMNAKICLTEEGKRDKPTIYCKNCFLSVISIFDQFH